MKIHLPIIFCSLAITLNAQCPDAHYEAYKHPFIHWDGYNYMSDYLPVYYVCNDTSTKATTIKTNYKIAQHTIVGNSLYILGHNYQWSGTTMQSILAKHTLTPDTAFHQYTIYFSLQYLFNNPVRPKNLSPRMDLHGNYLTIDYNNPDGPIKVNITNGFVIGYIRNELARREFLIIHN